MATPLLNAAGTPLEQPALRVGLTEAHGMAVELRHSPPEGVTYGFVKPGAGAHRLISSPIRGFLARYDPGDYDLIEAVLSPIITDAPWIYSLAGAQQATAFGVLGCPLPRSIRTAYIARLFRQDNFRALVFRSQAGRRTLTDYARIDDPRIIDKVSVVYPSIRPVPDGLIRFQDQRLTLLFTGDFFRKGGVNVVDAFERAQARYPSLQLLLCCADTDFRTPNAELKRQYVSKVRSNPSIVLLGRVPRQRLLDELLPAADIFLMPTYVETFGFAILEAMAYGVPIISTNHFAIPEMITHGVTGFLVDTARFNCDRLFKGYVVNDLPPSFRQHVTDQVFDYLCQLIDSVELRRTIGLAAVHAARTRFSVQTRNRLMLDIYRRALP